MNLYDYDSAVSTASWMNTNDYYNAYYQVKSRTLVGDLSYLYKKYSPTSPEDFYNKYINDTYSKDGDVRHHGRTQKQLMDIARRYQNISATGDELKFFYDNLVYHYFIQTYEGHKHEQEIMEYLKSKGKECKTTNPDDDAELGLDLEIDIAFIQVKPITFFYGNRNESLINDRLLAIEKYGKAMKKYNKPTVFAIYNKVGNQIFWLKNKNGGILHKIENLIDDEGKTKLDYTLKCSKI